MSNIMKLIRGIESKIENRPLSDVVEIKNGRDYKKLAVGNVPVYGSGGIIAYVDQYVYDKPSVLIPRKGSLDKLYFVTEPFWNVDTIFYTVIDTTLMEPKFLYYVLASMHLERLNKAGGVPSLTQSVLNKIHVPVPPLEVQQKIVRILDQFTQLTAELTEKLNTELTARKKQFTFYKTTLFQQAPKTTVKYLDEISENCDNLRKPVTSGNRTKGDYPYYGASGIVDYVDNYIFDGDYLLVSEDGANLLARSAPIAFSITGKNWVNNHAHVLHFEEYTTRRYVEFYLNAMDLSPYVTGGAQPKLNQKNLNRLPIPLPPLPEQRRIVAILDRLDALCNDLTSGLSVEIAARQKQYEYYRDKLLTFPERKN